MKTRKTQSRSSVQRMVRRRLLEQIVSMVEKAYRRGFQQGLGSNSTDAAAYKFRYKLRTKREQNHDTYHRASCPPWGDGQRPIKSGTTALCRLEMECPLSFEELRELIESVKSPNGKLTDRPDGAAGAEKKHGN